MAIWKRVQISADRPPVTAPTPPVAALTLPWSPGQRPISTAGLRPEEPRALPTFPGRLLTCPPSRIPVQSVSPPNAPTARAARSSGETTLSPRHCCRSLMPLPARVPLLSLGGLLNPQSRGTPRSPVFSIQTLPLNLMHLQSAAAQTVPSTGLRARPAEKPGVWTQGCSSKDVLLTVTEGSAATRQGGSCCPAHPPPASPHAPHPTLQSRCAFGLWARPQDPWVPLTSFPRVLTGGPIHSHLRSVTASRVVRLSSFQA